MASPGSGPAKEAGEARKVVVSSTTYVPVAGIEGWWGDGA